MKNLIILLIFIVGTGFSGYSQSKKLLRTYGITKKTETVVKYKDGKAEDPYVSEVEMYDKNGEWIERIDYEKDGAIKKREVRKYQKGILVEEIQDKPQEKDGSGKSSSYKHRVYVYNKKLDLMEEMDMSRKGEVKQKETYTYNKYGDVDTRIKTDKDGKQESIENYTYDKKGFKDERRTLSTAGELLEVKSYSYE